MDTLPEVTLGIEQQSSTINYRVLDLLVRDYISFLRSAQAKEGNSWAAAEVVERTVASGNIGLACDITNDIIPAVLKDSRLLFRLKRQQFIEDLRVGTSEYHQQAIGFLRKELAPLALDAYPEAYGELKRCLMTLVFQDGKGETPVTPEWSLVTRAKLAAQLGRTYRQAACAHDNHLAMILRYLALTYESLEQSFPGLQSAQVASIGPAVERLGVRLDARQPPPTPLEACSLKPEVQGLMSRVTMSDIQRLKNTVGISREEAISSLRHADASLERAVKNELSALPLDRAVVDALVDEYAASRGLSERIWFDKWGVLKQISSPSQAEAMAVDKDAQLQERRESERGASPSRSHLAPAWQDIGIVGNDISADFQRQPSRSPPKKIARCRGQSPGSCEKLGSLAAANSLATANSLAAANSLASASSESLPEAGVCKGPDRQTLLGVRELVEKGAITEAIAEVRRLDAKFFEGHPRLLFELHVLRFQALLDAGDTKAALALARSELSAISSQHPGLQPALKATLGRLLPGMAPEPPSSPTSLAIALEEALSEALCIREPQLVSLLKALLAAHTEWFKLQRCKDHFESFLGLEELKSAPLSPLAATNAQPAKQSEGGAEGSAPAEESPFDEDLVTDAMEVTNLGRAAVLTMLQDVGGNLEALLENLFS